MAVANDLKDADQWIDPSQAPGSIQQNISILSPAICTIGTSAVVMHSESAIIPNPFEYVLRDGSKHRKLAWHTVNTTHGAVQDRLSAFDYDHYELVGRPRR